MNNRDAYLAAFNECAPKLNLPTIPKNHSGFEMLYDLLEKVKQFHCDVNTGWTTEQRRCAQSAYVYLKRLLAYVPQERQAGCLPVNKANACLRDLGTAYQLQPYTPKTEALALLRQLGKLHKDPATHWRTREKVLFLSHELADLIRWGYFVA